MRRDNNIGGDFNLVPDIKKDKKGGFARNYQKSLAICEDLDLIDPWRVLSPDLSDSCDDKGVLKFIAG